ncbi:MAG TPA: HPP family protein [Patescibacteria group bacterium]|nr:HPP family protein [Patescibacteria group bacterium]
MFRKIVQSWGSTTRFNLAGYLWVAGMLGLLAALEANKIGLYLVPPFGATLTILFLLPDAAIAQPYAVVGGSVAGAAVGTITSLFGRGIDLAVVAAVVGFAFISLARAYHPPGVALAIYPILLHPGNWFPLAVVLPFTAVAVGSAALLSKLVQGWPPYPKPLLKDTKQ